MTRNSREEEFNKTPVGRESQNHVPKETGLLHVQVTMIKKKLMWPEHSEQGRGWCETGS